MNTTPSRQVIGESAEDWMANYQDLKSDLKKLKRTANALLLDNTDRITTPEYKELQAAMKEYQVEFESDMFTYGLKDKFEKAIENFKLVP